MGLGKTVQSIAFLLEVLKAGVLGPFLIIVPLSTVGNWQREFENWSDLNAIVYHGSAVSRRMIQEYELFYHRKKSSGTVVSSSSSINNSFNTQYRHDVYKFNALITTFEVLMSDIEFFGKMHWAVAIIDEAHRLKNKKCKLGEGLRYLDFVSALVLVFFWQAFSQARSHIQNRHLIEACSCMLHFIFCVICLYICIRTRIRHIL